LVLFRVCMRVCMRRTEECPSPYHTACTWWCVLQPLLWEAVPASHVLHLQQPVAAAQVLHRHLRCLPHQHRIQAAAQLLHLLQRSQHQTAPTAWTLIGATAAAQGAAAPAGSMRKREETAVQLVQEALALAPNRLFRQCLSLAHMQAAAGCFTQVGSSAGLV
jgi:hypothetical protein